MTKGRVILQVEISCAMEINGAGVFVETSLD